MNPISLSGGVYSSALTGMRPGFPMRSPLDGSEGPAASPLSTPSSQIGAPQQTAGFDNLLGNFVKEVNGKQMAAADTVTGLLSGQNVPLHQAMISMEEASVSFQLMVEVRNKLLEGYQELMRMQI